jgi:hypothetical protein
MKTAVLLVLLIAAQEFAQQHAPTVDQCRADASVWNAAVMNHHPEFSKSKLPVTERFSARAVTRQTLLMGS